MRGGGAPRNPPIGVHDQLRVEQDAGTGERRAKSREPFLGRVPAGRARDHADLPRDSAQGECTRQQLVRDDLRRQRAERTAR